MDLNALFQISYGMYLITTHDANGDAGCLVNTVFQITAEPVRIGVSVSKHNLTYERLKAGGTLAVNVVGEDVDTGLLGRFGYRSGREFDKFSGIACRRDEYGNCCIDEAGILSQMSCKVIETIDLDTHSIFLCEVTGTENRADGNPMTYRYFREVKKLKASKYAPTYHE